MSGRARFEKERQKSSLSSGFGSGRHKGSGDQAASDSASDDQVEYIRDLQAQCGYDVLMPHEAKLLTVAEAARMIRSLKADVPPPDPDTCPDKWDKDIWSLVLLFEKYARADEIELRAGRTRIYTEIDALVTHWDMRKKSGSGLYVQEVSGCARRELGTDMAAHCWYHWPPGKPADQKQLKVLTWVEVVEIIMAELWSRVMDEHALEHFRQHFAEYGLAMANHWKSLRIKREIASQPRDHVRPIVRRRVPSGTIAVDSKEG
jgi:hypothetical protein